MSPRRMAAQALVTHLGDWRTDAPAYEALADRIRLLLIDGRIAVDTRLPSERELSERLDLSRTTITSAYRLLRETGFAVAVQGSGTTTALPAAMPEPTRPAGLGLNLAMASLPATSLLGGAAEWATGQLPRHTTTLGYHLLGLPELRQAIADRYTARGLPTSPGQIMVTSGAQHAIALLTRTLITRGDRAYAESPSYPHAYDALREAGARIVTSPVTTDQGWDIEALSAAFARTAPTCAYLMPDFHNPTARSMTEADRASVLAAAAGVDATVIADETTAELLIDPASPATPLATAASEYGARVIQIGSASKLLWGGLRIGWIRADAETLSRVATLRHALDLGTPVWDQLVVTHLLGRIEEIIEERRVQLRAGRDAVIEGVARHLPEWELPAQMHGGLSAWVKLPQPVSSQLTLAAQTAGMQITAGPRFGVDGAYERNLRIPLAASPSDLLTGLELLGGIWAQVTRSPAMSVAINNRMV